MVNLPDSRSVVSLRVLGFAPIGKVNKAVSDVTSYSNITIQSLFLDQLQKLYIKYSISLPNLNLVNVMFFTLPRHAHGRTAYGIQ